MEGDTPPPEHGRKSSACFTVVGVGAAREGDRILQTTEFHGGMRMVFSMSEEQTVVLIGKLAASLHPPKPPEAPANTTQRETSQP